MNLILLLNTVILAGFFSVHMHAQPDLFISSAGDDGMHWYQYPDWKKYAIRKSGSWSEDCQILDIDNDVDIFLWRNEMR